MTCDLCVEEIAFGAVRVSVLLTKCLILHPLCRRRLAPLLSATRQRYIDLQRANNELKHSAEFSKFTFVYAMTRSVLCIQCSIGL